MPNAGNADEASAASRAISGIAASRHRGILYRLPRFISSFT
jgi:hypothetical protein